MIDSIMIARSGLRGFEEGLRTISNNTANLNTPGFKGSSTSFADLAFGGQGSGNSSAFGQAGLGLNTLGTSMKFFNADLQSTGNPLDLAIDGDGFFTLRDDAGHLRYSQDGRFKFDTNQTLVSTTTGEQVMSLDADGNLVPITLVNLQTAKAVPTTSITFTGNVSSTARSSSVNNVTVIDATGTTHTLSLKLTPLAGSAGSWTADLMDGTTTVGTATLVFASGQPVAGSNKLAFSYTLAGGEAMPIELDFSSNVTSFDTGTSSTLAVASQNGMGVGTLKSASFDDKGMLVLSYSNGKTVKQSQLALAQFRSPEDVQSVGSNEFAVRGTASWSVGVAGSGQFGAIRSGMVAGSNVDLSQEFSELVIMQRGYQACSQVVSTASDMLNALFGMLSK